MRVEVLIEHLAHDGRRVAAGEQLDLSREQAEPLLALGAVREAIAEASQEPPRRRGKQPD
jgi:hypothetical protein